MKKLILLLFVIIFSSCEKYELVSEPSVAGEWKLTEYYITIKTSISKTEVIYPLSDTICINGYTLQSKLNGDYYLKQDYNNTAIDRRFIKNKTMWLFSGPSQSNFFELYINKKYHNIDAEFPVPYLRKEYVDLVVKNGNNGITTNYVFLTDGIGQNYSKKLTLTSPIFYTDLYTSQGMRDKALSTIVTLIFMRN